mmetsp:Transcript_32754/g.64898  ORF Transcript_32754/g.64898 Transcript_32754/m.64898 type:complete len:206 (+) Transcript_32754:227-844(+)|eukprot:CAMPEP_0194306626 /NCGR_PEP_ID=MMETSP0171-20130528/3702_1 /TAXON_ID=218684 /ORGANISM="Corethron pennatum, Strain L29A3" /LENGTH=205 /DNA_ID=CAMNT_0039058437 /DNA_START=198 /DNA_END=815 /DNA_ORIENTATION=-
MNYYIISFLSLIIIDLTEAYVVGGDVHRVSHKNRSVLRAVLFTDVAAPEAVLRPLDTTSAAAQREGITVYDDLFHEQEILFNDFSRADSIFEDADGDFASIFENADAAAFATDDFFENDFADDEYAEVDSIFDRIDIDGNGSISCGELRAFLTGAGFSQKSVCRRLFDGLDIDDDGAVSREEMRFAFSNYEEDALLAAVVWAVTA